MIKIETDNTETIFKPSDLAKRDISRIGKYDQYTILYSTNIIESENNVVQIFPLDNHEDWSIRGISEDSHLKNVIVSDQDINGWIGYLKECFYGVPEVETVFYKIDKDNIDIWIMIPDRNLTLLRKLIDVEMNIIDKFEAESKSIYIFEFHIIYRCGIDEKSLTPSGVVRINK